MEPDRPAVRLPDDATVLPGFVDLHVHAPQYAQLGLALDVPLEAWLTRYTFPLEARFADLGFADRVYAALIDDLLAGGTTTALMFATVHVEATARLVDVCVEKGFRSVIGKVAMDHPEGCPPECRDASPQAAVEGTRAILDHVARHPGNAEGIVRAAVTPRFIPSCTDAALEGLGALARETGATVQTHVSESDWQHGYAVERFGRSDAESLDGFGLLGERTVLAHGTRLADGDLDLLARRGAAVAHCPYSNAYFGDAVFPLRAALAKSVKVGLGTDISGGPSLSMWDAQRLAVVASRMLSTGVRGDLGRAERLGVPGAAIGWREAFHLATAGGAKALGLAVGTFMPGQAFDAVVVRPDPRNGTLRRLDARSPEDELARILMTASRADIAATYVAGCLRHSKA